MTVFLMACCGVLVGYVIGFLTGVSVEKAKYKPLREWLDKAETTYQTIGADDAKSSDTRNG